MVGKIKNTDFITFLSILIFTIGFTLFVYNIIYNNEFNLLSVSILGFGLIIFFLIFIYRHHLEGFI